MQCLLARFGSKGEILGLRDRQRDVVLRACFSKWPDQQPDNGDQAKYPRANRRTV
jgi:hypothetical protein